MRYFIIMATLFVAVQAVYACDLCAVYTLRKARGEAQPGWYGGAYQQFTRYDQIRDGGRTAPNPAREYLDSSQTQLIFGYQSGGPFGWQVNVPVVYREYRKWEDGHARDDSSSGLGDMTVMLNYLAWQRVEPETSHSLLLSAGIKFPTGRSKSHAPHHQNASTHGQAMHHAHAAQPSASAIPQHFIDPGHGTLDAVFGASYYGQRNAWLFTMDLQTAVRTQGDLLGADLFWSGGPGRYWFLRAERSLATQWIVSGEHRENTSLPGRDTDGRSLRTLYTGPRMVATVQDTWTGELGVEWAFHYDSENPVITPDYRVKAGLTYRF